MTEKLKIDRVAIVGTAPTSKMLAPFDDQSWQIWTCSMGNMDQLPRVNVWFEIHALSELLSPPTKANFQPFIDWLKAKSEENFFDVVMQEFNPQVPKAIPYPRDEMIGRFGRNWFTSSVAYMMALAIARDAKEIALFGVDMAADQEHYSAQRAGCVRFIEIAEERGIKVTVPYESCLKTATPMYGYWEGTPFGRRLIATRANIEAQHTAIVAQIGALTNQANYFGGALEQLKYFERTWTDGAETDMNLGDLVTRFENTEAPAATGQEPMQSLDGLMAGDPRLTRAEELPGLYIPPLRDFVSASQLAVKAAAGIELSDFRVASPEKTNGAGIPIGEEH